MSKKAIKKSEKFELKRRNGSRSGSSSSVENEAADDKKELLNASKKEVKEKQFFLGKDNGNFALLVILYLLQGIPTGLTFGSIPFLLKSKLSYSELAIFSLTGYPYSLKLFWSPIVDSIYVKSIGRRKSWIIPIFFILGFLLYYLGIHLEDFMTGDNVNIGPLTTVFCTIIFLAATQDIAVDGWALTLLSEENIAYASTSQTVGLNAGFFVSFTIFLALNSVEFGNKYIRSVPSTEPLVSLSGYLSFWAIMYFIVAIYLILFKDENEDRNPEEEFMGVKDTYTTIFDICKSKHMMTFIAILLTAKIGFVANDSVTNLKLIEKGFPKEDLAFTSFLDFPLQLIFGFYIAKVTTAERPLKPWLYAFYAKLVSCLLSLLVVYNFPSTGVTSGYLAILIASNVLHTLSSTIMFVGMGAFFSMIADPTIGGTYMTVLNTINNLGGTWPQFFVLEAVELFTKAECSVDDSDGTVLKCVKEAAKAHCKELGGTCNVSQDGYYWVVALTVCIAFVLSFLIRQKIKLLEKIPINMWRIKSSITH